MGIREELSDRYDDDLLFADGYDGAIIGVCGGCDSGRVAYDTQKMVEICVSRDGMTYDEAITKVFTKLCLTLSLLLLSCAKERLQTRGLIMMIVMMTMIATMLMSW